MAARASGCDIYHGNGVPTGQDFVILKATEGTTYVDPTYGSRAKAVRASGAHLGAYHFAHPELHSAQAEVDHFASVVGASVAADVSLWLDLEAGLDQIGAAALRRWKNDWITAARRVWPNNRVGLYVNRSYWAAVKPGAGDGLWIATPGTPGSVGIADPWLIHQYSEAGGIDRDVFNGTVADLAAWAGAGGDDMATTPGDVWGYDNTSISAHDAFWYVRQAEVAVAEAQAARRQLTALAADVAAVKAGVGALSDDEAAILAAVKAGGSGQVDVPALAAALRGQLAPEIVAALGQALSNG
jgi:hypothetical protein